MSVLPRFFAFSPNSRGSLSLERMESLFRGGSRSVQFVIKVVEWDVRRGSKSDLLR